MDNRHSEHTRALTEQDTNDDVPTAELVNQITADRFQAWYQDRKYTRNIRKGQPYFNGPSQIPEPTRHAPSTLLQCHRKITYRTQNAPKETPDPEGLFWIGNRFEEDIALPFLQQAITGPETYVTNSLWIDTTVDTDVGEIRMKGETDPVIVDADGEPLLLTEIKTKRSVSDLDAPNRHHKAQAHAYMYGLSEKYEHDVTEAVIMYGGRTQIDVECFHLEFDQAFWRDTVLEWAQQQTEYRVDEELPPADPVFDWECEFCAYRERCGEGEKATSENPPRGLLPSQIQYPRSQLEAYLEAHTAAKLTPELAEKHPDLAETFGCYPWLCEACHTEYPPESVEWNGLVSQPPDCPDCASRGVPASLRAPPPATQRQRMEVDTDA